MVAAGMSKSKVKRKEMQNNYQTIEALSVMELRRKRQKLDTVQVASTEHNDAQDDESDEDYVTEEGSDSSSCGDSAVDSEDDSFVEDEIESESAASETTSDHDSESSGGDSDESAEDELPTTT